MKTLLTKLNYKGQKRIAVINADESFLFSLSEYLPDLTVDKRIDLRFPYDFMILFVKNISEVECFTPVVIHNLLADGVLWFCYPKKTSKKYKSDLDRDHGWKALNDSGLYGIRMVAVDEDWSAMRFRNIKFIRSASEKYNK